MGYRRSRPRRHDGAHAYLCSRLSHRNSANIPGRSEGHPRGETRRLAASCGQCAVLNLRYGADFAVAVRLVSHRALSFEDCAVVDDQLRRSDVADDFRGWVNLDSIGRGEFALDLAANDDRIGANLRGRDRALADGNFLAVELAVDSAVDTRRTLEVQLAADLGAAVQIRRSRRPGRSGL